MTRARVAQQPPAPDLDLTGFPTARPTGDLVRAHSTAHGPWYFANDGGGRFDLQGDRGTCYAADTVRTAVRERLGESCVASKIVAFDDADAMTVSVIEVVPMYRAAAISAPGADDYPVTGELANMSDYTVTQAWAQRFDEDTDNRFDGIQYRSRFAIADAPECWATFGPAGPADRPVAALALMDGHAACAEAGLTVTPPPPMSPGVLTVILPPGVKVIRKKSRNS
ncbi:RES family NAD+ phosphorylase [Leifsonia sp. NPDC102414]|uniref:RES family NAD+ phosphorylase n=1 Tax=Leifsonia sp. NPDC102414 TaxID=3364124 RepID=UPI0038256B60